MSRRFKSCPRNQDNKHVLIAGSADGIFSRRSLSGLQSRAYVDARYSPHYEITTEELAWLVGRIKVLQSLVKDVCEQRLCS